MEPVRGVCVSRSATVRTVNGGAGALRRPFSLLDRLRLCQDAWAPGVPWDREEAHAALWGRPAGVSFSLFISISTSLQALGL